MAQSAQARVVGGEHVVGVEALGELKPALLGRCAGGGAVAPAAGRSSTEYSDGLHRMPANKGMRPHVL